MKHDLSTIFVLLIINIIVRDTLSFFNGKVSKHSFRHKPPNGSKIIGGKTVGAFDLQFLVYISLTREEGKENFWGVGSLLSKNWTLTNRHLFFEFNKKRTKVKKFFKDIWVIPAFQVSVDLMKKYIEKPTVQKMYCHPWTQKSYLAEDIALIRVSDINIDPDNGEDYLIPANLPAEGYDPWKAGNITTAGWGANITGGKNQAEQLQLVTVPVRDQKVCKQLYHKFDTERWFCAGDSTATICNGDSGAPGVLGYGDENDTEGANYTIVGIGSFNDKNCTRSGGFINVAYFRKWIDEVMDGSSGSNAKYACRNLKNDS